MAELFLRNTTFCLMLVKKANQLEWKNWRNRLKIWIDADATPAAVKEVIFRAVIKRKIETIAVANRFMHLPKSAFISFQLVDQGADKADAYIAENVTEIDLVITADVPLADLVVKKQAQALDPRGYLYTAENIAERLSIRTFMEDLRSTGYQGSGPKAFGPNDVKRFAAAFDRFLTKNQKNLSHSPK